MAIEVQRHEVFPIPVWVGRLTDLEAVGGALADAARLVAVAGSAVDLDADAAPWRDLVHVVQSITDELADASEIGWRERTESHRIVRFDGPEDVAAEQVSLASHARGTFSAATWVVVPPEADQVSTVSFSLRNPYNHLTKRYRLPTYAHHGASPLAMIAFPSFLETFFEVPPPARPWGGPAIAVVSDVHYY